MKLPFLLNGGLQFVCAASRKRRGLAWEAAVGAREAQAGIRRREIIMTTLPQTTTVRPPQSPALASPSVAYVPAAAAGGAAGMTGADVWRVVRANLWLILIFALLFGAGGYLLNRLWLANWPSYTAVGLLQLRTNLPNSPIEKEQPQMADTRIVTELRTESQKLTTDTLFSAALKNRDRIRDTKWFKSFATAGTPNIADAKEDLRKHFRASPLPDTTLLAVSMTCSVPVDAKVLVDEIVDEYLEQQRRGAEDRLAKETRMLSDMREMYSGQIKQVSDRVRLAQANLTRKGVGGGTFNVVSTKETELRALVDAELKLSDTASSAKAAYDRVQDLVKNGQDIPEVERSVDNDPTVIGLTRDLANTEIQLNVAKTQRGEQHPEVARIKAMVDMTQAKLSEQRNILRSTYRNQFISALEGQSRQTQDDLKTIQKQVDAMKTDLADLSREIADFLIGQEEEKAYRELYAQYNNRLTEVRIVKDPVNQMRIEWAGDKPEVPEIPTWPKLWVLLPMSIVVGLGLAVGIAFLREYMDDTVRSPRDVGRVGQMNVLGIVADAEEDPQVANARLPIFDAPHSITAEQFRQIRTRLQHVAGLDTNRSLMVTGPSPLDGKTTVAANLAAALALNGRKTLLVDANVRRPEIHRLFGVGNEKGFSDVLNGTVAFDEALRPTRIPNLTVMTSGPKPMNPTELFESQLLVDFIERALEEYDHVIFDSGPFLVVSEPVAMAPRVDGVITVVRAHAESRGLLQRMRDQLRQVKAEHLGVVVNAVRAQGGGYYRRNIKAFYNYNEA
jgi:tyrosine-protein kinase Etk/Wzc